MTKAKVALVMAAAMCVFAATVSASSAATFNSTISKEAVVGAGGNQTFTVGAVAVKCTSVSGQSATITFPTEQIVSTANYAGCSVTGLGPATVTCASFNFHSTGTVSGGTDSGGTVTNGACSIVVAGVCTITVPAQNSSGVSYINSGVSVRIVANVTGLHFTASAGCIGFSKSGANAVYAGELTVKSLSGKASLSVV